MFSGTGVVDALLFVESMLHGACKDLPVLDETLGALK